MTPAVWGVVLAGVVALLSGGLVGAILVYRRGTRSDLVDDLAARLAVVEGRLATSDTRYSKLWSFTRLLIDYAYRHRKDDSPPLPDMPDDLI